MNRAETAKLTAEIDKIPGKRGRDIPEATYDQIRDVADGITMPLWGRPATPYQMQHLYDNGAHDPSSIHDAFSNLQHPHAPSVTVGEYQNYAKGLQVYRTHG